MKKILACVLTAAMTLSLLTACGGGSGSGNAGNSGNSGNAGSGSADSSGGGNEGGGYKTTYGDKQFDNVTITVELFDRSNAPEGNTILDNKWTKYAQEQMQKVDGAIAVSFGLRPRQLV